MLRKLGFWMLLLGLALPVSAVDKPGSISGYVRSSSGVPQMGAVVEVVSSAAQNLRVFTDEKGFFSAPGLQAGTYAIRVSAPAFLTAWREHVGLRAGGNAMVNVTLNTLFEALQFPPGKASSDDEDWKWVLRSVSNRPILRVLDDGTTVVASAEPPSDRDLKGSLSFYAGSETSGYGSDSDMTTGFSMEKSIFSSGTAGLQGNVGYGPGSPSAVLRASYAHRMPNGSKPEVALTMRRLAAPDANLHSSGLQAFALTTSDDFNIGDVLELKFGSEMQTIQFMGRVSSVRPFGSADLHLSPNTLVEYAYATSVPDGRREKGFDSAPADLSESGPRVSINDFNATLERAHHHELSVSRRIGKTSLQFAAYSDRIADPALTGVGSVSDVDGNVLPDVYSESFTYQGAELRTRGVRAVVERKLTSNLTATADYAYGGVLDLDRPGVALDDARQAIEVRNRHALSGKLAGKVPCTHTRWIASYGWENGEALTPVDMFNTSPGATDPYLDFYIRQPIPGTGFMPAKVEALVDVRNLLAQGYVPVLGNDGHTVYLVQSARSVRGGLAFTF